MISYAGDERKAMKVRAESSWAKRRIMWWTETEDDMAKFDPHAEYTDLSARLRDKAESLNRSVHERKAAVLMREAAKGIDDLLLGLSIGKDEMNQLIKDAERFRWLSARHDEPGAVFVSARDDNGNHMNLCDAIDIMITHTSIYAT